MTKTVTARVTHRFSATPERVFDAWLDPVKVRLWMGMALEDFGIAPDPRRVEIEAKVGGRFTFSDMREQGEAVHFGTYLEIDRPRRLAFTWFTSEEDERESTSIVTLTIERDGDGCAATVEHEMDVKWADYTKQVQKGWATMLAQIEAMLNREG